MKQLDNKTDISTAILYIGLRRLLVTLIQTNKRSDKIDGVDLLVADPPPDNSITGTETQLLSDIGPTVCKLDSGCRDQFSHIY